jgi:hypothetical protein
MLNSKTITVANKGVISRPFLCGTATISLAWILGGCSFAPVGENRFDCNRKDSPNEYCKSIKAVERSTRGDLPETRYEKEFDMQDYDRAYELDVVKSNKVIMDDDPLSKLARSKQSPAQPAGVRVVNYSASVQTQDRGAQRPDRDLSAQGMSEAYVQSLPIRQAPVVQRVYIKSYVDADDMLVQDQIIYKEITRSRWIDHEAQPTQNQLSSIRGESPRPHRAADPESNTKSNIVGSAQVLNNSNSLSASTLSARGRVESDNKTNLDTSTHTNNTMRQPGLGINAGSSGFASSGHVDQSLTQSGEPYDSPVSTDAISSDRRSLSD